MSESITVITLLLSALDRVHLPALFDRDGYESRRSVLPGARLVKVLVVYQMIGSEKMRGLIRVIIENASLQAALGGTVALNTLSNGLAQRTVEQMVEAWMLTLQVYGPWLKRMGRKFARVVVVDASLIKLSLLSYSWAEYRKQTGAAKMHAVLEWGRGIPQQLVVTTGKVHDLRGVARLHWARHWTYIFDRAYLGFDFLRTLLEAGAHFVVRFKAGVGYRILDRFIVPQAPAMVGFRLTSDWTIRLPGWEGVVLRLISQRTPRRAGGLQGMAVSKTANGYLEPTVLVDLFLFTDILLDSLQFKTHCRYRMTPRPEMLTGEVPYLPTKLTCYHQGTFPLQKPYHRGYGILRWDLDTPVNMVGH